MSKQYPGGFITKSPVVPTVVAASGIWTVDQAMQYQKAGTWPYAGPNYIENVFSTYLYTGNSSTQTITNDINLSGYGGMIWIKKRSANENHYVFDSARNNFDNIIFPNLSDTQITQNALDVSTTGFSFLGASYNNSGSTYASWTFRKQPKFFDIVTYTGNATLNRQIAHNLGSVPGCIIIKSLDSGYGDWIVYHRSIGNDNSLVLNSTAAMSGSAQWYYTNPTSTNFTIGNNVFVNTNFASYVAYVFAHDAGGFGLTGSDNVISCGSYTLDASGNADITLGYEPQWVLLKKTNGAASWITMDTMRGFSLGGDEGLIPNSANAAFTYGANAAYPTATGFSLRAWGASGSQEIYIAIRKGPMKVPTDATKVFAPVVVSEATSAPYLNTYTTNFPVDSVIEKFRGGSQTGMFNRLLGNEYLIASSTSAGITGASTWDSMSTVTVDAMQGSTGSSVAECFRRAPGFFDEVCYTGTGSNTTITHNLGAVPELIIVKRRDTTADWDTYCSALANTEYVVLNTTAAKATGATRWNSTTPTASVFSIGTSTTTNASAGTYVAYLFATCAGVSKVGSYTGTAALLTVNCGFTSGARFVLIKRTDSTGDWYVYDSARGISSGTDPYLLLNSTAAETTGTNYVDTDTTGFKVTAAAPAGLNANGGTYIFLAIA